MAVVGKMELCIVLVVAYIHASSAIVQRTCEGGSLSLFCPSGSVINVNAANYGRTAGAGICPHRNIRTTSCFAHSSLNIVTSACDGRSSCSVRATNSVFGDPCRGTYKYLEVDFNCLPDANCITERTCEGGSIWLHCPRETPAIHICNALYGRKVSGSALCNHRNIRTTNCAASSSMSVVQSNCQGKSSCHVSAANNVFGDPCVGTYKYLEIKYTCARRGRACEGSTLAMSCPSGQTILVLDASYGRTAGPEICPHARTSDHNCHASSSLNTVENSCNGISTCTVGANNQVFGDPCVGTYKYLDVLYKCV